MTVPPGSTRPGACRGDPARRTFFRMPATLLAPSLTPPRPRWIAADPVEPELVARLGRELGLPAAVCALLVRRGHADAEEAKEFLRPGRSPYQPARDLAGMPEAVERLMRAREARERVLVHGDYDVDGICSTALLVRGLTWMGCVALPFVPHRLEDGYDLGDAGIAAARDAGATLIVTADCGIVAHGAVERAIRAGIDVVVTDHHAPAATLPAARAVVNPHRADCSYAEKGLSGAGVAFKLLAALAEQVGFEQDRLTPLLDLVALATVADLVPLRGENRALVRRGLAVLRRTPNPGLRALVRTAGLADGDQITAGQVGFILAPRLNAAGRLGAAMRGVELLLTDDPVVAERIAGELEVENRRRRELDRETLADALRLLEHGYDPARDFGVVLASERWHPGVIGIVASRIVERIHRPTVLIALGEAEGKGSARSIRGFHLRDALDACAPHLLRFGGHRAAAGCSLEPSRVGAFREAFNDVARERLAEDDLAPRLQLDGELSLAEADHDLLRVLRHFAPCGVGNPAPVFAAYGVRVLGRPRIVGKDHLKLRLGADDASLEAIGFGMAERLGECTGGGPLDVAFKLEENGWAAARGRTRGPTLQARLVDLRVAG
jgi:single-stranded-DNA-specific exonuclease